MRIPFISTVADPVDLGIEADRFHYIADTRGGSAFLLAGSAFWLIGAVVSWVWPAVQVYWVIYAGLGVPFLALAVGQFQGARLGGYPVYASLAAFATLTELAALPTMLFVQDSHPEALPGILMIADGAHLVIFMWLHLDYTYFIAANIKIVLGVLFLFGVVWTGSYPAQLAAAGVVSLVAALFIWRDSQRTLALYVTQS